MDANESNLQESSTISHPGPSGSGSASKALLAGSRPPSPHHPQPVKPSEGELQGQVGHAVPTGDHDYSGAGGSERPLNVSDALGYLDQVKMQFSERPDVYNKFLDIMKDFKSQLIDTPGVIERVSNLFHGHPSLIQGFNTFLPAGYRIETTSHPDPNYITVTTPAGTTTQATNSVFNYGGNAEHAPLPPPPASHEPEAPIVSQETLKPALDYVTKVRTRYANEPEMYRKFLSILSESSGTMQDHKDIRGMESWSVACLSAKYPQGETLRKIGVLLQDAPDLMRDFIQFLPDEQTQKDELARVAKLEEQRKAAEPKPKRGGGDGHASSSTAVPQKRKRKVADRDKEKELPAKSSANKKTKVQASSEAPSPALTQRQAVPPPSPPRAPPQPPPQAFYPQHQQPMPLPQHLPQPIQQSNSLHPSDDRHFFERVKRALDNRDTYNEFLKLVNLFTQDIINTTRLVREARSFLGDGELMAQFKAILGWDERKDWIAAEEEAWTRPMGALDRPSREQLHTRYGSYRKLPAHEVHVQCSGRDEMCNAVLNDEWISQPTFASEDAGFIAHKKNIYEEALHRSEEERHEYDFHIEAIHRTIQVLEPLNNKIAQLTPEERANFKLKPNLGGVGKAIHQRVIKKIYGRDPGLEVWTAMQEVPATAIPVVLTRLKQKHEEWKRAQREWDKVWREVDLRNYHKSLDHQAVTFKAADKKAVTQKAFVSQIEAARDEQRVKRAALIDPLFARTKPRHQLEFVVEDTAVLQDTLKLTFSFLDRTQGQIALVDRKKIETFLRSFVPLFFMLDPVAFNAAFVAHHESMDGDGEAEEDVEMNGTSGGSSRSRKKGGGGNAGDLRKRLLKSEQAKSSRRTRAQEAASPTPSRFASPVPSDPMQLDGEPVKGENGVASGVRLDKNPSRRRGSFFTNTAFYVMLRLLELLYSRLQLFKNITAELVANGTDPMEPKPSLVSKLIKDDLAKMGDRINHASHYYDLMLESCEKLFDNELEQHAFEEITRYLFGLKHAYKLFTVDKVIGALIKQVQVILSDPKSQELFDLLRREREITSPTTQDLINCRRNTERVLGPDENLFRVDWLPEPRTMTIQLIGKDDSTFDDSEVLTGRWQSYIESFVSHHYTAGVPSSSTIRRPFLLRTRFPAPSGEMPDILARGRLQIKVCVRTYRFFFVPPSEDVMIRLSSVQERADARVLVERRTAKRKKWMEDYASKIAEEQEPIVKDTKTPSPSVAPTTGEDATPAVEEAPMQAETTPSATETPVAPAEDTPAPTSGVVEVEMDVEKVPDPQPQALPEPVSEAEATAHVVPEDDVAEAAAAVAAVIASAVQPDPEDVPMAEAVETPVVVPTNEPGPAPAPAPAPEPQPVSPEPVVQDVGPSAVSSEPTTTLPQPPFAQPSEAKVPVPAPLPVPPARAEPIATPVAEAPISAPVEAEVPAPATAPVAPIVEAVLAAASIAELEPTRPSAPAPPTPVEPAAPPPPPPTSAAPDVPPS
ncbi:uncharacterized protein TRAVEDRAFT_75682 [Trametes versicolor FP-101664 SS1]|uniref:Histone deacetylase interacting domain-containing protein n=1 Tax=Trametes versicolor (strain FP-101664) TaxID=717944 RepID=R7S7M7_TRAVS|nr:uncharacterized protein TRAVEDRAFT_75682 [Trametes versicolor FP-101664 SS1]EIW51655.1 hypothetical protein TRAVEDRAFT_75682 [Trametes versicolor FP-101664 SS1]